MISIIGGIAAFYLTIFLIDKKQDSGSGKKASKPVKIILGIIAGVGVLTLLTSVGL